MKQRGGDGRLLVWSVAVLSVIVLLMTGYVLLSGEEPEPTASDRPAAAGTRAPSPASTYAAPKDWSEPLRWAALPRGARTDALGHEVGFPHRTEGAVAMLVASNSSEVKGSHDTADEQLGVYESYLVPADRTETNRAGIEKAARETDAKIHRSMRLPVGSVLPPGAYARNHVVGFRVVQASSSEAAVWLLSRVTEKAGETAAESGAYTCTLAAAQWDGDDWRLSSASAEKAMRRYGSGTRPPIAAPGDAAFNDSRWTAIREAS
ncbi:hypothetical protein ACFYWO_38215 [Streptomyces sp. NPDC002932]|uniref:hypothetical protein n=1 Tax=Streptomyces sp. NPDC002932 TaxID=3364672 RepID=UPI0036BBE880